MPAPVAKHWVLTPRVDGTLWMSDDATAAEPTWDVIPTQAAGPSYPFSLGPVVQWINDPDGQSTGITVRDATGTLVATGVVSIVGGNLMVNSAPVAGEVALRSTTHVGTVDSNAFGMYLTFTIPNLSTIFTQGIAASHGLRQYYNSLIPAGHAVTNVALHTGALVSGLSIDVANEEIDYNGSGAVNVSSVGVDVTTAASLNAASDWAARSTAAGVLWSQLFTDQALHIDRFLLSAGNFPGGTQSGTNPSNGVTYAIQAGGGILGNGCMRINVPINTGDQGRWSKPFGPLTTDLNNPGAPTVSMGTGAHATMETWQLATNPNVAHPTYQVTNPFSATEGQFRYLPNSPTTGKPTIYWQFRCRVSPGRFGQTPQMPVSKFIMLQQNNDDQLGEVCQNIGGYGIGPNAGSTSSNGTPHCYTGKGSFESILTPGNSFQLGGLREATCTYPSQKDYTAVNAANNTCLWYPENQWVTFHGEFTPGRTGVAETVFRLKIAYSQPQGGGILANTYYDVYNVTNAAWQWDTPTYNVAGHLHPRGLNRFMVNTFTGGGQITPAPAAYWTEIDQIIFSLQPIAVPQV